jgi:hypothetical protein
MKQLLFWTFALAICVVSCKKDPVTNTTLTKKIKKTVLTDSAKTFSKSVFFYYDNNDNLTNTYTIDSNFQVIPFTYDTSRTMSVTYVNNLPSTITLKVYDNSSLTSNLVNTFVRHFTFNNQNQITKDSLISLNLQFLYPYTSSFSYKDTINDLTNRTYIYSGSNTYKTSYNSPLLNKPYVWTNDTLIYTNDNLTKVSGVTYQYNPFTSYIINITHTNNLDPLYFGLLPFFGQSKYLMNTMTQTNNVPGNINTSYFSYQYFFDSSSNLIKQIETRSGSSFTSSRITTYEYY